MCVELKENKYVVFKVLWKTGAGSNADVDHGVGNDTDAAKACFG